MGVQWRISPKFLTSATYSVVEAYMPENSVEKDAYKHAQYLVANLFYNITPSVQAGKEYLWGSREDTGGNFKQDTRLQSAIRVNF